MKVLVIGAGAIGTLVAARLAAAGNDVAVVSRKRPRSIATVSVEDVDGRVSSAEVSAYPSSAEAIEEFEPELSIVAVKGYDTESVVWDVLAGGKPIGTRFLTLQNGVGNEEALADAFGAANVISGAITIPAERLDVLSVRQAKRGMVGIAPVRRGDDVSDVVGLFEHAGFDARRFDDYQSLKWSKLMMNMTGNAIPAILGWTPEKAFGNRRIAGLEVRALKEAVAVMEANGIRPVGLGGYPLPMLVRSLKVLPSSLLALAMKPLVARGRGGKKPSLLLDLESGKRKSEVGLLNGAVARFGKKTGVATQINECVADTLEAIFEGEIPWAEFRDNPGGLLERCAEHEQEEAIQ